MANGRKHRSGGVRRAAPELSSRRAGTRPSLGVRTGKRVPGTKRQRPLKLATRRSAVAVLNHSVLIGKEVAVTDALYCLDFDFGFFLFGNVCAGLGQQYQ